MQYPQDRFEDRKKAERHRLNDGTEVYSLVGPYGLIGPYLSEEEAYAQLKVDRQRALNEGILDERFWREWRAFAEKWFVFSVRVLETRNGFRLLVITFGDARREFAVVGPGVSKRYSRERDAQIAFDELTADPASDPDPDDQPNQEPDIPKGPTP